MYSIYIYMIYMCTLYLCFYECSMSQLATDLSINSVACCDPGQPESPRCDVQLPSLFHPGPVYLSSEGFFAPTATTAGSTGLFVCLFICWLIVWLLGTYS